MAEPSLKPSTLALREGETEDNTKGIRTRYRLYAHLGFQQIYEKENACNIYVNWMALEAYFQ